MNHEIIKSCRNVALDSYGGGDYFMETYKGEQINHAMWLCFVTEHVFGGLPAKIYVDYPINS